MDIIFVQPAITVLAERFSHIVCIPYSDETCHPIKLLLVPDRWQVSAGIHIKLSQELILFLLLLLP